MAARSPAYVELHARSAFSFLRGGSLPEHLAQTAATLGHSAMALCDRMGVCGAPRFFGAAREGGLRPIVGAELVMDDESVLPVLVESRAGYQNLCRLLTKAHLRAPKGEGRVRWDELPEHAAGLVALTGDTEGPLARAFHAAPLAGAKPAAIIEQLTRSFGPNNVFVEVQRHFRRDEGRLNTKLRDLARAQKLPLLATNGVLYATPDGRRVADVFSCLRHHTHLDAAGRLLAMNDEPHIKTAAQMAALFGDCPEAVNNTVRLAERLEFNLTDLGYEFPRYPVGPGETMESVLRAQALAGARERYRAGVPAKVRALLEKELALIEKLGFAGYFLIVADLVRFCRSHDILAQGRGSAANSAVCFCLGITAVDPVKFNVLFERFLSEGRKGWPDIDIDLPSGDRREKVIQNVYQRYGRHGAAMTATVITYRGRSAGRELGKVLNLPVDILDRFSEMFGHGDFHDTTTLLSKMETAGLSSTHPRAHIFAQVYQQMSRLPRHLGQHTGGMIICQGQLDAVVPLENASMQDRVVAQWDKDDCEEMGIIKVDLLGLGMMSVLQDATIMCAQRGRPVDLAQLPENDPKSYDLIQRADTIGLFQIESRAQMATLPRLKPACFYDLVVEVAIIRPGPIQGDLAHPYLRRRSGEEAIDYYDHRLIPVLERTLGVPLFQEQMLQMAMVMADFTGTEAEELRRAVSCHRSPERMQRVMTKLHSAMERKGVDAKVVERIVQAVGSFALYGFPESHAISFALLAYASAYLKAHRAAEFYCALFNNQPMGFYSAATLVKDAQRHGLTVRPVCVARSQWETTVESDTVIRLGLHQVEGLRQERAQGILRERAAHAFASTDDFKLRTRVRKDELRTLASIGALNVFAADRRSALWDVELTDRPDELLNGRAASESTGSASKRPGPLRPMEPVERLQADYNGLGLTTGPHPMALVRDRLPEVWTAADLRTVENGQLVRVAGLVICRQRPGTAKGICFVSLEDETGICNVIVNPKLFETERLTITMEPFLAVSGQAQSRDGTIHIKAHRIERLAFAGMSPQNASHDFH